MRFFSLLSRTLLFYSAILWCVPHLILLHIPLFLFLFVLHPVCLLSLYIFFLFSFSKNRKLLLLLNLLQVIFSSLHFPSIFLPPPISFTALCLLCVCVCVYVCVCVCMCARSKDLIFRMRLHFCYTCIFPLYR